MNLFRRSRQAFRGFTLIEGMVMLFLFSLITLVFFQTFAYGTALIQQSKYRLGAIALANQKMEIIRSLDYGNIGTVSGIPSGDLIEDEAIQVSNALFQVHTFVQYADDPYDGTLSGSPNDLIPNDYKRVRIEVAWGGESDSEKIALFSTFAPLGVEQSAGGGILSINILDSQGNGLPGASVHITNSAISPSVDVTTTTDASGNLFLVGAPASAQEYHVTFSKSGYFGSASYAPYPTTSFIPVDVHASVVDSVVNQATFVMDRSSTLQLRTVDPFGNDVPAIDYRIDGDRLLGNEFGTGDAVYEFGMDDTTDASGEQSYSNRSYGSYSWTIDPGETGWTFISLNPESSAGANIFELPANTSLNVDMVLADESVNSALFTVTSAADGSGISGASIHLTNTTLGFDETANTNLSGKAFFPTAETPGMTAGTYDYEVTAAGFTTETGSVTVASGLESVAISMSP